MKRTDVDLAWPQSARIRCNQSIPEVLQDLSQVRLAMTWVLVLLRVYDIGKNVAETMLRRLCEANDLGSASSADALQDVVPQNQ